MYKLLYEVLLYISFPFIFFFYFFKYKGRIFSNFDQRLGFLPYETKRKIIQSKDWIWIHTVSVGEARIGLHLIPGLRKIFPERMILFSTVTPSGNQLAKKESLADLTICLPLDFNWAIRRTLSFVKPILLILIETELWPNFLRQAKELGVKIILVNGRISNKSYRRCKIFHPFVREILSYIDLFAMREDADAERIVALGAPREKVKVTGNMKYDPITNYQLPITDYKELGFKEDDLIWVCGSTREGEEKIILEVYLEVLKKYSNLKLVLAPRHLERIPEIESLLKQNSITFVRKSQLPVTSYQLPVTCLLWDTYGELMKAYTIATIVFVGGSLVSKGGHNILEPASLGKPIIFGPHMENFQEPAALLLSKDGAIQVKNEKELKLEVINLLENSKKREEIGENARNILLAQQGATEKNFELINTLLR